MNPSSRRKRSLKTVIVPGLLIVLVGVVAAVWLGTPLRHHLTLDDLVEAADHLERLPMAPLIVMAVYVVGVLFFVPVSLLIAATGAVFGSWLGLSYALAGSVLSALATYGIGFAVGGGTLARLAGSRIELIRQRIAQQGFRAMLFIRLVPVAPFIVINVVAGASHIRLSSYLAATVLGMTPGIILKVVLADGLVQAAEGRATPQLRVLLVIVAVLLVAGWAIRRFVLPRLALAQNRWREESRGESGD